MAHPSERKYKIIATVLIAFAVALSLFNTIYNPYNVLGLGVIAAVTFINKMKLKHRFTLFTIFVVSILGVINLFEFSYGNEYLYPDMGLAEKCLTNFSYAAFLLAAPLVIFYVHFIELIKAMEHEKKYYRVIKYSPHLICKTHLVKTQEQRSHGFKSVSCRKGETCLEKNYLTRADAIVGLVGVKKTDIIENGNYYLNLRDLESGEITDADYDVIEIHENLAIKDYNGIISKIVSFFYNELDRYKPLNEIIIRIIGNPQISESTKRLMKERFLKIEYLSN